MKRLCFFSWNFESHEIMEFWFKIFKDKTVSLFVVQNLKKIITYVFFRYLIITRKMPALATNRPTMIKDGITMFNSVSLSTILDPQKFCTQKDKITIEWICKFLNIRSKKKKKYSKKKSNKEAKIGSVQIQCKATLCAYQLLIKTESFLPDIAHF